MNQRKPPGLRASQGPQAKMPAQGKNPQQWYRRRPYYPDWYWRDYDWYDWDWYDHDWYDYEPYGGWEYSQPTSGPKSMTQSTKPVRTAEMSETWVAYQQGFKDGWKAAMDYMVYGMEPVDPGMPPPAPEPITPKPPIEGAPE